MANNKKQRKTFKTYLPKEKKPFKVSYDCPLSEELNVKEYNVLIDSDPVENQIYINLGYLFYSNLLHNHIYIIHKVHF